MLYKSNQLKYFIFHIFDSKTVLDIQKKNPVFCKDSRCKSFGLFKRKSIVKIIKLSF